MSVFYQAILRGCDPEGIWTFDFPSLTVISSLVVIDCLLPENLVNAEILFLTVSTHSFHYG
jgi:hypothetical protein